MSEVTLMNKVNEAWNFVHEKLFYKPTSMFYDYLSSKGEDGLIRHIPSPEHIKWCIPNPCGWSSGMENAVLSGGMALDTVINRYECEKDESLIPIVKRIYKGMRTCGEISKVPGFLVRCVSPVDGVTHYIDSSRDQYTHFVYSGINYYDSGLATDDEKESIAKIIISFAERAAKNITEENSYNFLREDGKRGAVTCMWKNICPHEFFRLPMIYIAAYNLSGDKKFYKLYMETRDEAMDGSEKIELDPNSNMHTFAVLQMMYSLKIGYLLDDDENFKKRCLALMMRLADYGKAKAILSSKKYSGEENAHIFTYMPKPWNEVEAHVNIILDGYAYYIPNLVGSFMDGANMSRWALTDVGDGVSIHCLCPGKEYDDELMKALCDMINTVDYDNIYTDGPISLLNGYWFMKSLEK